MSAATQAQDLIPQIVYGTDDRFDYYEVRHPGVQRHFRSIVALFETEYVKFSQSHLILAPITLGQEMNLCPGERYAEQISAASCSGFLIAPDLVMTAGHCVNTKAECSKVVMAFDYLVARKGIMPAQLPLRDVYRCKEVVYSINSVEGDFAILRLDRIAIGREPLALDLNYEISTLDSVFMIGHPTGIPSKAALGFVRASFPNYVETNLDASQGSSGSPVFNMKNGLVAGILVEGDIDLEQRGACFVNRRCTDRGCRGEDVARISAILKTYKKNKKP